MRGSGEILSVYVYYAKIQDQIKRMKEIKNHSPRMDALASVHRHTHTNTHTHT